MGLYTDVQNCSSSSLKLLKYRYTSVPYPSIENNYASLPIASPTFNSPPKYLE